MSRPAEKSRARGLFKECEHPKWDFCPCPWLGRAKHVRRVNLAKWAGVGKAKLNRSEAIDILADVRGAVLNNEFDPSGKTARKGEKTFGELLNDFERDYVAKRRADGKLRSSSFDYYLARYPPWIPDLS